MAIGFTQYNRRLGSTATGTQGARRSGDRSNPPVPGNPLNPQRGQAGASGGTTTTTTTTTPSSDGNPWWRRAMDTSENDARKQYYESRIAAQTSSEDDEDALAAYLAGEPFTVPPVNYGSGSSSSSADRLARTGATNQNAYFQALLAQAPGQYQGLRDLLASQRAEREAAVNAGIEAQRAALTGRYTTAQADVARAYDDLRAALEANAPRAYANLPRATAPELAPDAVSRYAQAVGAPTQSIAEAAVQEAARSAGTGEAYNRLLANLQANEAAQQASRLAGVGMGRTAATGNLTALQQAGLDRIEAQKQAALNQILAEIQQGQFGIAQGQLGYEQGLRQALAGLYGTGYVAPTGV